MKKITYIKKIFLRATILSLLFSSVTFAANYKGERMEVPVDQGLKDGFYLGAQAGYDSYSVRDTINFTSGTGDVFSQNPVLNPRGFAGGLFAGYGNYLNNWFYLAGEGFLNSAGVQTNYLLSSITTSFGGGLDINTFTTKVTSNTNYGVAALPGIKVNNDSLFYIRLGYNWSRLRVQELFASGGLSLNRGKTQTLGGFTYGLGLETKVYQNFSMRGEYTYTAYNSFTTVIGSHFIPSNNQFMFGLLYHFA